MHSKAPIYLTASQQLAASEVVSIEDLKVHLKVEMMMMVIMMIVMMKRRMMTMITSMVINDDDVEHDARDDPAVP
jgi:hypothetical protein